MPDVSRTTETIGTLLARVRAERGISQLRLAARLCASASTTTVTRHEVSRWEREERIPTGYWLAWLATVLELPLSELEVAAAAARRLRRAQSAPSAWAGPAPDERDDVPGWLGRARPGPAKAGWREDAAGVYVRAAS